MPNWNEFAVLVTDGGAPRKMGWETPASVFPAETCARLIFFAKPSSLTDVPPALLAHPKTYLYQGRAAYEFALTFAAGLKGQDRFDKEVAGQVREGWNQYKTDYPESHRELTPYLDALFHDAALIKSAVLAPFMRQVTLQNIAVETADLTPADGVLVIGGAETMSVDIITSMGHFKKCNPGSIIVTHPVSEGLSDIQKALQALPAHRQPEVPVRAMPFRMAMAQAFFEAKATFVAHPIPDATSETACATQESILDFRVSELIREAWQLRRRGSPADTGKLVHLKGNPLKQCATTGSWMDLDKDPGFVSCTALKRTYVQHMNLLKRVILKAHDVVRVMVAGRFDPAGEKSLRTVQLDPTDLTLSYRYTRASRGRGIAAQPRAE